MKLQTTHRINYNLVFRVVFISILVCVCFVASSFMVLESSEFFERFYTEEGRKNFGFISALLNEVFLVIMASVWVPAIQRGEIKKFHPANVLRIGSSSFYQYSWSLFEYSPEKINYNSRAKKSHRSPENFRIAN